MKCITLVVLMALASAKAIIAPLPIIAPFTFEQPTPISYTYAPKIKYTQDLSPLQVPYPVAYDTPLVYTSQYPSALRFAQYPSALPIAQYQIAQYPIAPLSRFAPYPSASPVAPLAGLAPYPAALPVEPIAEVAAPAVAVAEPTYIATNRGSQHIAPLPGHTVSVVSENLEAAPGTF